jgi:hypothetical protein
MTEEEKKNITVKLHGNVRLSTTYGEDKDPVYHMTMSVKAPSQSIARVMQLFESKVPVEVIFYSPQIPLIPDDQPGIS